MVDLYRHTIHHVGSCVWREKSSRVSIFDPTSATAAAEGFLVSFNTAANASMAH